MNYNDYLALVNDAKRSESAEMFCSECGYFPYNPYKPEDFVKVCEIIYATSKSDFARIIEISGLKTTVFAHKFNIPYRTVQNWKSNSQKGFSRNVPEYVIELIGYAMIQEIQ